VETSPALQLGGLQAARADPRVPFGSTQDFQQFGWQCSLTIAFLWVLCTSDHLTSSSSSALFNLPVYLMLKTSTKLSWYLQKNDIHSAEGHFYLALNVRSQLILCVSKVSHKSIQ